MVRVDVFDMMRLVWMLYISYIYIYIIYIYISYIYIYIIYIYISYIYIPIWFIMFYQCCSIHSISFKLLLEKIPGCDS